jgi:hypothetical protein
LGQKKTGKYHLIRFIAVSADPVDEALQNNGSSVYEGLGAVDVHPLARMITLEVLTCFCLLKPLQSESSSNLSPQTEILLDFHDTMRPISIKSWSKVFDHIIRRQSRLTSFSWVHGELFQWMVLALVSVKSPSHLPANKETGHLDAEEVSRRPISAWKIHSQMRLLTEFGASPAL